MSVQLTENFSLSPEKRQAMFLDCLRERGLNLTGLAVYLDLSKGRVSDLYRAEAIPPHHWAKLRALGLPEECLPRAEHRKTGPAPKPKNEVCQQDSPDGPAGQG